MKFERLQYMSFEHFEVLEFYEYMYLVARTTSNHIIYEPMHLHFSKPTPVEWRYTEEGDKVRVSARTGRVIPISKTAEGEAEDYVNAKTYQGMVVIQQFEGYLH